MTAGQRRSPGAAGIGALLLGLLTTPWVYAAFGALSAFPSPFAEVATPLLIVSTLDLGLEAFACLRGFRRVRLFATMLSAAILLTILMALTEFTLLTADEQIGLFATIWLGAAAVWLVASLPVGEVGLETILRSRLTSPARRRVVLAVVVILFATLAILSWRFLVTPQVPFR